MYGLLYDGWEDDQAKDEERCKHERLKVKIGR